MPSPGFNRTRRRVLLTVASLLAPMQGARSADARIPLADMHSHYGLITRRLESAGLAEEMRSQRVALVAWNLVADMLWIRAGETGISQVRTPGPGELAAHFTRTLGRMKAYIAAHGLKTVLGPADVDACVAGEPGIVLASEGADFLESRIERLDAAYAEGLRHLQFVHYIASPVGDAQTAAPTHTGLSNLGKQLIEACNARRILVDLAHSTGASIDQALAIAKVPFIWSHGWVGTTGGRWQDKYGYQQRRLSLADAKKIADRGGVIGLWGLGLSKPNADWPVGKGDTLAYARELAKLVDKLGSDHVAFGTDIEGVGPYAGINAYTQLRAVLAHLEVLKLPSAAIERIAYRNYARVLKGAL